MRNWFSGILTVVLMFIGLPGVASAAQSKTSNPLGSSVSATVNLVLCLIVVIVLAVVAIRFLASKSQVQQKGSIQVVAARQLAPNRSVQIIDVQGKRYLIGVAEQITMIADVTDDLADEEDQSAAEATVTNVQFGRIFADALRSVRDRYQASSSEGDER